MKEIEQEPHSMWTKTHFHVQKEGIKHDEEYITIIVKKLKANNYKGKKESAYTKLLMIISFGSYS